MDANGDIEQRFRTVGNRVATFAVTPLLWLRISANQLTYAGLLIGVLAAWALYRGVMFWAVLLMIMLGICDWLDGQVARATNTTGPRGALLDSVTDRVSDAVPFIALMLSPRSQPLLVWLSVWALLVSILIPYAKARAESLGCKLHGALLPRAPRFILLLVGVALGPVMLTSCVGLIAGLGSITVFQRMAQANRQLG